MRAPKEVRHLVQRARDEGWRERPSNSGVMLFPPDPSKRPIPVHSSRGRWKGPTVENFRAQLRRAGLDC